MISCGWVGDSPKIFSRTTKWSKCAKFTIMSSDGKIEKYLSMMDAYACIKLLRKEKEIMPRRRNRDNVCLEDFDGKPVCSSHVWTLGRRKQLCNISGKRVWAIGWPVWRLYQNEWLNSESRTAYLTMMMHRNGMSYFAPKRIHNTHISVKQGKGMCRRRGK